MLFPQPPAKSVNYTFRAALEANAFHQMPLLDLRQFGRACKQRGVELSFGSSLRDRLEELDRTGALCPIAFDRGSDEAVVREETAFVAWDKYQVEDDYSTSARPLYSNWQLLYAPEARELGRVPASIDWVLDEEDLHVGEAHAGLYRVQREVWRELDERWRGLVLVLVRLQGRYSPFLKGTLTKLRSTMVFDPETGEHVDPYWEEARRFVPEAVLAELELTADDIKELCEQISMYGHNQDPIKHWHMLFRMSSGAQRAKLEGAPRRAHDCYDAAEMLRRFYYDLTGELLPNPDEIFDLSDKSWKRRLFGRWPFLAYTRADLTAELRRHDLWPHEIQLIVEGKIEALVCRHLLERWTTVTIADLGVHIATLDGVGRARLHEELIRATRKYARWVMFVADREGDIERDVARFKREGLLSDETAHLWDTSFEEANFTDEELVAIVGGLARESGVELRLTADEFRSRYDEHQDKTGREARGAMNFLLGMARDPKRGGFPGDKNDALAIRMAEFILEDLERRGEPAINDRPILKLVGDIIRAT